MGDEGGGEDEGRGPRFPDSCFREKPVRVGEELDVTVTEPSRRGDGTARLQGYVASIPNLKQGAQVRVTMIRPNYAIAEVVTPSKPSTD
jgi:predicted RNA-binding protein with TRAM domain